MKKQDYHQFKGMQRDLSISKQPAEFLWDAHNIRLTAREGDTMMSITNERGADWSNISSSGTSYERVSLVGQYVGHCVIRDYLTVFTHNETDGDRIYRIYKKDTNGKLTFDVTNLTEHTVNGNTTEYLDMNFSTDHPLQTLGVYENEKIQKVYWTDGINQPRMINIVKEDANYMYDDSFDFVPEMTLRDSISIRKIADSSGIFGAGVIQYYVSYYNKYGQETNISLASPLIPTSFAQRAGSPEERIGNSFEITVYNPDTKFEYMRLYSMFRSSKDATPSCKRVADLRIGDENSTGTQSKKLIFVDNGTIGDDIDPQELLYIGGESITAETIEQKDGTLFMGNINVSRPQLNSMKEDIKETVTVSCGTRIAQLPRTLNGNVYKWGNSLCAKLGTDEDSANTSTAGFKSGEHYRLGLQFQYKTGKWSEPIWIGDEKESELPSLGGNTQSAFSELSIPTFKATINADLSAKLLGLNYKRVRPVVVFPTMQDRLIQAQGALNPTVYSIGLQANGTPHYQSSWFFRPWPSALNKDTGNLNSSDVRYGATVQWQHGYSLYGLNNRGAEVQGVPLNWGGEAAASLFSGDSKSLIVRAGGNETDDSITVYKNQASNIFCVDQQYVTMHSPEFEFDDSFASLDLASILIRSAGRVFFEGNVGDIDIQTSTPTIGTESTGFFHKTTSCNTAETSDRRLCAGLFYWDWLADDWDASTYGRYTPEKYEFAFMVYPWQRSTSLNNDCNRPSGSGTRSAMLSTKKISNLKFAKTSVHLTSKRTQLATTGKNPIQLFNDDQVAIVKINDKNYYGNVDMLLTPVAPYGAVFSNSGELTLEADATTTTTDSDGKLLYKSNQCSFDDDPNYFWYFTKNRCSRLDSPTALYKNDGIGKADEDPALAQTRETIRMKYKSTPHVVISLEDTNGLSSIRDNNGAALYLAELYREGNSSTDFGGTSDEAIESNLWYPCGDATTLSSNGTNVEFKYGDTWFQRYDCLKTYAYTTEDPNQVIEIGSFMVETHVNIDGRYDRNRGQDSNLNISPTNFNLINTVYSQLDNFFNYRILDSDYYKLSQYSSMVTWSTAKSNASDVDNWTTVTLASTLEIDGTRGEITALATSKDMIYAFQRNGITQILFNSRVMVSSSDNVPIEISNNYKVDGNRYISTAVGCNNKFAIAKSPNGIYFIDGISGALYLLVGDQLQNISDVHGFGYWFSQQKLMNTWKLGSWDIKTRTLEDKTTETYTTLTGNTGTALYYDFNRKDLYICTSDNCLCYSELLNQFISFFDYKGCVMCNIGDTFHALVYYNDTTDTGKSGMTGLSLWNMFKGNYNNFFLRNCASDFTFISNADATLDKIFTNLEMRMDIYNGSNELQHTKFMEQIKVWNEYQDTGDVPLKFDVHPYSSLSSGLDFRNSNIKKKFRIWRCNIPRALKEKSDGTLVNGIDRIRNTWCKIKLTMNIPEAEYSSTVRSYNHAEIHDVGVIYYC